MVENPRTGRQARTFTTNVPKIVDVKSSSEQIFFKNCRSVPLVARTLSVVLGSRLLVEDRKFILIKSKKKKKEKPKEKI